MKKHAHRRHFGGHHGQRCRQRVDDGMQNQAVFQQHRNRTGEADQYGSAGQFGSALAESRCDIVQSQSADNASQDAESDEDSTQFNQVPTPFGNSVYQNGQSEQGGQKYTDSSAVQRWLFGDLGGLCIGNTKHQAGFRISPHASGVRPDVMKADGEEGKPQRQTENPFPTPAVTQRLPGQ